MGLMMGVGLALAAPTVPVQGALADAEGAPVDGARVVSFALYDVPSGGSSLWSETATVSFAAGAFAHALGSSTALDLSDWQRDADLWLQITVDGVTSTRAPVGFTARALHATHATTADDAATLGGRAASGFRWSTWVPTWADLAGDPSGSSSLTDRIQALAYDAESELTTSLDDNYAFTTGTGLALSGSRVLSVVPSALFSTLDARYTQVGAGNGIATSASAPASPTAGMVYWDTTLQSLRVWDGSTWGVLFQGGTCGQSSTTPAPSCKYIRDSCGSAASGTYWLKPAAAGAAVQAYCEENTRFRKMATREASGQMLA